MLWSDHLCRLCGLISTNLHSISELLGTETVEFKIKKCLNLDVLKENYNKPKEVCEECVIRLEQFCEFIDICIATNEKFDSLYLSRDAWPETEEITDFIQPRSVIVNLKDGIEDDLPINSVSDDVLPLVNVPLQDDVLQIVQNTNIYNESLQEANTDEFLSSNSFNSVLRHTQTFSYEFDSNDSRTEKTCTDILAVNQPHHIQVQDINIDLNNRGISGNNCGLSVENINDNNLSLEIINNESNEENISSVLNRGNLINLKSNNNDNNKESSRGSNGQEINNYLSDDSVEIIETTKNKVKKNEKLISVDIIRQKLNLKDDDFVRREKVKKRYDCPQCEKFFMRRLSLNAHMAVHTRTKPYSCDQCDKSFSQKRILREHEKIHTDLFKCTYCSKTFNRPCKLKRHIYTHTKEKPFRCKFDYCGKYFSDKSNLTEHERIHSNEKSLECNKCNKKFSTRGHLKSHLNSHTTEATHICDICKCSFKYKNMLTLHMKKHTGYKCNYCNIDCGMRAAFLRHRKECKKKNNEESSVDSSVLVTAN